MQWGKLENETIHCTNNSLLTEKEIAMWCNHRSFFILFSMWCVFHWMKIPPSTLPPAHLKCETCPPGWRLINFPPHFLLERGERLLGGERTAAVWLHHSAKWRTKIVIDGDDYGCTRMLIARKTEAEDRSIYCCTNYPSSITEKSGRRDR